MIILRVKRYPENGWALYGLYKSLEAQEKYKEAKAVKKRFDRVWENSDINLTASRL